MENRKKSSWGQLLFFTFLIEKIVPIETLQSMLEDPSSGSIATPKSSLLLSISMASRSSDT